MDFRKLQPARHPRLTGTEVDRSESKYWRSFKSPVFLKSYAPISAIHFAPSSPHRYCITSGTRLQIYSPKTGRVLKTISRFQVPARCGEFRHDGKLVVAGDDSGLVQVFDVNSRAILRSLKGHAQPVYVAKFSPPVGNLPAETTEETSVASSSVLTCSDDATVRLWDLATASPTSAFTGHDDYVRAGSFVPTSPHLVLSGSYDRTLKLWDTRASPDSGSAVWTADHGYPVESVLVHPSGTLAISAGGPVVRIWDLLGGSGGNGDARCLRAMSNHQKTVTSLAWTGDRRRLLSAGLDGLVKVYDASEGTWRVRHTMRYGGSLLSLGVSPSDDTLIVGAADGGLSIRKRIVGKEEKERRARGFQDVERGLEGLEMDERGAILNAKQAREAEAMARAGAEEDTTSEEDETTGAVMVVKPKKKKKLKPWDRMLKSFRYGDALDAVLRSNVAPNTTFSLLLELMHRDGLDIAISGRDDVTLLPLMRFLVRNVCDPRWCKTACDVANAVCEIYSPVIGRSPMIDEQFNKLRNKIAGELRLEYDLMQVNGQVEMVMAAAISGLSASA